MTGRPRIVRDGRDATERFWSKVAITPGCWPWKGSLVFGYGQVFVYKNGRKTKARAHRLAYEAVRGPVPAGLDLDHLCRNRACVNPFHLEAVTRRENLLRGETIPAAHARKTHCPHGHRYDKRNNRGDRICLTCDRDRHRVAAARKREEVAA